MKTLITTLVLAAGTASAFAAEYTNFDIPPGTLSRAEVRAAIGQPNPNGSVNIGDATQFVAPATMRAQLPIAAPLRSERINTRNASFLSTDLPGRI
jgi:hypothetical protein